MLLERFANHYNRTLFGMYPRNRRGESSQRGEGIGLSLWIELAESLPAGLWKVSQLKLKGPL